MRVSTGQLIEQSLQLMLRNQQQIGRIRDQIATGERILTPADDPRGAARVLQIDEAVARTEQFQENAGVAESRLSQSESVLQSATASLQRVRELALQARSDHLTAEDRGSIAAEVRQRLDELVALANSRDGSGEYLFAGYQGDAAPFARGAGGAIVYNGDQGRRFLQVGPDRQIADRDSGAAVFMNVRNGNGSFVTDPDAANTGSGVILPGSVADAAAYQGHEYRIVFTAPGTYDVVDDTAGAAVLSGQSYAEGAEIAFDGVSTSITGAPAAGDVFHLRPAANQPVFETVERLAAALETELGSEAARAQFQHAINRTLGDVDLALERFNEVRTDIGARLQALEAQRGINDDLVFQLASTRSEIQDVNLLEAATELNRVVSSLEAAQQAFIRTQGLSLFEFL